MEKVYLMWTRTNEPHSTASLEGVFSNKKAAVSNIEAMYGGNLAASSVYDYWVYAEWKDIWLTVEEVQD